MISVKEIIIVEGAYDKIKLSSFIEGIIFVTGGFSIMTDSDRINGLSKMIEERGAVILTDSDSAGLRIRNFLKQHLPSDKIKNAYIPGISGKEKRKRKPGAEGILGVEGMTEDIIMKALINSGCNVEGENRNKTCDEITKKLLYSLGLTGGENSKSLRRALNARLGLPANLSSNMLCEYLSGFIKFQDLKQIIEEIKSSSLM